MRWSTGDRWQLCQPRHRIPRQASYRMQRCPPHDRTSYSTRPEHVSGSPLLVSDLRLKKVTLADHRRVQLDAAADRKAPLVVRMAGVNGAIVQRTDLVCGGHDLGRAPGLVDAQVADDIRRPEAA